MQDKLIHEGDILPSYDASGNLHDVFRVASCEVQDDGTHIVQGHNRLQESPQRMTAQSVISVLSIIEKRETESVALCLNMSRALAARLVGLLQDERSTLQGMANRHSKTRYQRQATEAWEVSESIRKQVPTIVWED